MHAIERAHADAEERSRVDALTGLANRLRLEEELARRPRRGGGAGPRRRPLQARQRHVRPRGRRRGAGRGRAAPARRRARHGPRGAAGRRGVHGARAAPAGRRGAAAHRRGAAAGDRRPRRSRRQRARWTSRSRSAPPAAGRARTRRRRRCWTTPTRPSTPPSAAAATAWCWPAASRTPTAWPRSPTPLRLARALALAAGVPPSRAPRRPRPRPIVAEELGLAPGRRGRGVRRGVAGERGRRRGARGARAGGRRAGAGALAQRASGRERPGRAGRWPRLLSLASVRADGRAPCCASPDEAALERDAVTRKSSMLIRRSARHVAAAPPAFQHAAPERAAAISSLRRVGRGSGGARRQVRPLRAARTRSLAGLGQHDEAAAPVVVARLADDQPVALQAVAEAGDAARREQRGGGRARPGACGCPGASSRNRSTS